MCRKLIFLISFVFVLGVVGNPVARAAKRIWDNEGGDNRWDNPLNWSGDTIPTGSSTNARIVLTDAGECLIDSLVSAELKNVFVGYQGAAGDLRMTGGSLAPWNIYVGRESVGRFYLLDGTVDTKKSIHIGRADDGVGSLIMSGGTLNCGPDYAVDPIDTKRLVIANEGGTGTVTLTGGTLNISGPLSVGIDTASDGVTAGNGVLDMSGGTINVGYVADLPRDLRIGHDDSAGTVNMSDGTINVNGDARVGSTNVDDQMVAHPGIGTLTMSGGLISVPDSNALEIGLDGSTGRVNLCGGTISAGSLAIGPAGSGGILDITGGALVLNGDQVQTVLDYVTTGQITGYGSPDNAAYDYDVSNVGKTTVTAVLPAPAVITAKPLDSLEADVDPANPDTLVAVVKINGVDANDLVLGATSADFEKYPDHPAPHADNFDLTTYASLDDANSVQTVFDVPVTTIFLLERGADDAGFFQALDAGGLPIGDMLAFTKADFQFQDTGLKIVDQNAGGVVIEAIVPIYGLQILPPEGANMGIDPASVSAIPAQ